MVDSRSRAGAIVVALVFALAACGGGGDSPTTDPGGSNEPDETSAPTTPAVDVGELDCAGLRADLEMIGFTGVQMLAQIRSIDMVEKLESGDFGTYDGAALAAAIDRVRVLDAFSDASVGSAGDSLDVYAASNQKMMEMIALDGPPPQATVDEYVAGIGEIGEYLAHQMPMSAAFQNTGCE